MSLLGVSNSTALVRQIVRQSAQSSKPLLYGQKRQILSMPIFLAPRNLADIQKKALTIVNGGSLLIIGSSDDPGKSIAEFDKLVEISDRLPIAHMLNGGKLPWCELYTSRFDYEKTIKANSNDKPEIDGSVPNAQLPLLKSARTRYIIYNQSRNKNCQHATLQHPPIFRGSRGVANRVALPKQKKP